MKIGKFASIIGVAIGLAACGRPNIALTLEGEKVLLVELPRALNDCEELGTIKASGTGVSPDGDPRTVKARNKAARLGGNRIIVDSILLAGQFKYRVYYCPLDSD